MHNNKPGWRVVRGIVGLFVTNQHVLPEGVMLSRMGYKEEKESEGGEFCRRLLESWGLSNAPVFLSFSLVSGVKLIGIE